MLYLFGFAIIVKLSNLLLLLLPFLFKAKSGKYNMSREVDGHNLPPVSIIICARNEAHNLQSNLPLVLEQDYPCFEVVVVNDASNDQTKQVLETIHKQYNNLNVFNILPAQKTGGGKRQALQTGITQAKYEMLLLTDADCKPAGNKWIQNMTKHFNARVQIVLGYGAYLPANGWVNKLVQFETLHTAMQYMSFAAVGLPYMGVGRNLAYTKPLFYQSGGFTGQEHLQSGDDDLLINKAASASNTAIAVEPASFTHSYAPHTFAQWVNQKKRHLSAGKNYKSIHIFLLSSITIAHVLFYGMLIVVLLQPQSIASLVCLIAWFLVWTLQMYAYRLAVSVFAAPLCAALPLLDIVFVLYYVFFTPFALLTQKVSWRN
ncbi:MAG TPA: glycosyltransferase [Chitinophagales bacterium]|nr:glycosyltransferase [Chitinophagales bacterium]HRK28277.1 glycosyltransferase [Chitinophagales bacterium]